MSSPIFGTLTVSDLPFAAFLQNPSLSEAVAAGAQVVVFLGVFVILFCLTRYKLWGAMYRDWLTAVDHKKVGIMYMVVGIVMLLRGVLEGAVMRVNQAGALNGHGMLAPDHVGQLFSTHGTIMIFFVAVPLVFGLINYILPLQLGARDMAFPVMNQISLGLTTAGAVLIMISLVVGEFGTGGWMAYPPYTSRIFSPGEGTDYWIWAVLIAGFGSTMSAINFAVTIFKERAPGMKMMDMPIFCWTVLCSSITLIFAMPPITTSTVMLMLDRYLDFHFFSSDLGGQMMNYANLFWMFGHPEVYILVLPCYGIFAQVTSIFSAKAVYGYVSLVIATMAIAVLSFSVWLHHFFTMGQGVNVNIAFGIATMTIAIPTGVKLYDWMATMFRGRIRLSVPMFYLFGFFLLFVFGGLTGVILANPTIDYQVHNSMFLVAHFHNVLIPGVLYGVLAGIHMWFPKAFGFRLAETPGRVTAVLWVLGFSVTFVPLYWVGLNGLPRRAASFTNPDYVPWLVLSAIGAGLIVCALLGLVWTIWTSIRHREELAVPIGDPWDGRTLEWDCPSPPPPYNFAVIPTVDGRDPFAAEKADGTAYKEDLRYTDIASPAPTLIGFAMCVIAGVFGFAMIWQIWWLAVLGILAVIGCVMRLGWEEPKSVVTSADEVKRADMAWRGAALAAPGIDRGLEMTSFNRGLAAPDMVSHA